MAAEANAVVRRVVVLVVMVIVVMVVMVLLLLLVFLEWLWCLNVMCGSRGSPWWCFLGSMMKGEAPLKEKRGLDVMEASFFNSLSYFMFLF